MKDTVGLSYDDVLIVPKYSDILSRSECSTASLNSRTIDPRLPVICAPMDTIAGPKMIKALTEHGAIGILHRFNSKEEHVAALKQILDYGNKDLYFKQPIIISTGITESSKVNLHWIMKQIGAVNVDAILIDVAYGNNQAVFDFVQHIIDTYEGVEIIAGNVVTAEGAYNLCMAGVDYIRCGIGGGAMCTTRIKTGVGIPQVTAIQECRKGIERFYKIVNEAAKWWAPDEEVDKPLLIADGAISSSGDVCKALAAGADMVMIGSMLAGTDETLEDDYLQTELVKVNDEDRILYRGMASASAKKDYGKNGYVEGETTYLTPKGSVHDILFGIEDGLKSAMSYVGASEGVEDFKQRAELIRITPAGMRKSLAHGKVD